MYYMVASTIELKMDMYTAVYTGIYLFHDFFLKYQFTFILLSVASQSQARITCHKVISHVVMYCASSIVE